jgi:hypothetical protein
MPTRPSRAGLILLVVSVTLATLTLLGLSYLGPRLVASVETTEAIERNSTLSSCRSVIRSDLVDSADSRLDTARGKVALLSSQVLQAFAEQDNAAIAFLLPLLKPARDAVRAATEERDAAVARYQDLAQQSLDDPDLFIAMHCEGDP